MARSRRWHGLDRQVAAGQPGSVQAGRPGQRSGLVHRSRLDRQNSSDLRTFSSWMARRATAARQAAVAAGGLANGHQNRLFDLLGWLRHTRCGRGRAPWPGRCRGPASRAEGPHARAARAGPATSGYGFVSLSVLSTAGHCPGPASGVPGSVSGTGSSRQAGTGNVSTVPPGAARDIRHLIDTAVGARERGWAVARISRCPAAGGRDAPDIAPQIALRAQAHRWVCCPQRA